MNRTITLVAAGLAALFFAACSDDGDGGISVDDPRMQEFLDGFGSSDGVAAGLGKHGAEGLDTQNMELYDLEDPEVTDITEEGSQTCYTIDATAGVTTRTYRVCWEDRQIASIEDQGMR